jgi:hypothetical protein
MMSSINFSPDYAAGERVLYICGIRPFQGRATLTSWSVRPALVSTSSTIFAGASSVTSQVSMLNAVRKGRPRARRDRAWLVTKARKPRNLRHVRRDAKPSENNEDSWWSRGEVPLEILQRLQIKSLATSCGRACVPCPCTTSGLRRPLCVPTIRARSKRGLSREGGEPASGAFRTRACWVYSREDEGASVAAVMWDAS